MEKELTLLENLNLIKKIYVIYLINNEIYKKLAHEKEWMEGFVKEQMNPNKDEEDEDDSTIRIIRQEANDSIEKCKKEYELEKEKDERELLEKKAILEKFMSTPFLIALFKKTPSQQEIHDLNFDIWQIEERKRNGTYEKMLNFRINRIQVEAEKRISSIKDSQKRKKKIHNDKERYIKELPTISLEVEKYKGNSQTAKKTLECILKESPLHEKYYSFAYVCQIIDYLDTGRCSELTGPFGCYNLLEHELQMRIIIEQLEKINDSLNEIKGNQRIIIEQLNSIKKTTSAIFDELGEIKDEIISANKTLTDIDVFLGSTSKDIKHIRNNIKLITACASFNASSKTPIAYRVTMLNNNLLNKA